MLKGNPKFLFKSLIRSSKPLFFSNSPQRLGPEYDKREFDAFKHEYEKQQNYLGYSLEELYGKRYGIKHSPKIVEEMKFDSVVFVIAIFLVGLYVNNVRNSRYEENEAWNNYVHRDMSLVRPIPKHAHMNESSYQAKSF